MAFLLFSSSAFSSSNLVGAWKTDCVVFGRHSYISLAVFSENQVLIINRLFEHQNCTSHSITGTYDGLFSLSDVNQNGQDLDLQSEAIRFTLHLPQVVTQWNDPRTQDGCETKNWVLDIAQEVSGKYCRPFLMPTTGSISLDIIEIKNNELKFSRNPPLVGGPAANQRPTSLSDVVYRQIH